MIFANNQVAVTIAIGGRPEIGTIGRHHQIIKLFRVNQIGVRMVPAEIRQRRAIHNRALGRAKGIFKNGVAIGAGNGMHRIELNAETGFKQRPDGIKIEQCFHKLLVIRNRVDDFHRHAFDLAHAQFIEIAISSIRNFIA